MLDDITRDFGTADVVREFVDKTFLSPHTYQRQNLYKFVVELRRKSVML